MAKIDKWGRDINSYKRAHEYANGKVFFLTGASGFIGRVLIEKALRVFEGTVKGYILIRSKKGLTVQQRMEKLFSVELFRLLNEKYGGDSWKKKIIPLEGDVTKPNLGLSEKDQVLLINEVDFFYHNAASVRFDDSLKKAITINTIGTLEACKLALRMKHLESFVYISTSFSNCHLDVIEERIYPPIANWRKMINLAETMSEYELQIVSHQLIKPSPNTYTFAKHLSEHVVKDMLNGKISAVIIRPSIVLPSYCDPFVGWIDNFNGGGGLTLAVGKGILRTQWVSNDEILVDGVPVDYLVKAMILLPGYRVTRENEDTIKNLEVYNVSADLKYALTAKQGVEIARSLIDEVPLARPVWYPTISYTSSYTWYYIQVIFLHMIPAIFIDLAIKIAGYEPLLVRAQQKLYVASVMLQHFFNKQWTFVNKKIYESLDEMREEDKPDFAVEFDIDHRKAAWEGGLTAKQYLMGEDLKYLDRDKRNLFRMKILHYTVKYLAWMAFIYYVFYVKCDFWFNILNGIKNYFVRLGQVESFKF